MRTDQGRVKSEVFRRSVQLLGSGPYTVMLSYGGGGYSRWRDLAITRWREDPKCDDWGSYLLLRDTDIGSLWSAACQPYGGEIDAESGAGVARFVHEGPLETVLEVAVDDDAEVRRIPADPCRIALQDDGGVHQVRQVFGGKRD